MILIPEPLEFEWDAGNQEKNWQKHTVKITEIEEVFLGSTKKIAKDVFHSINEDRYILLGITTKERMLFIVFTIRHRKVRVISARDLNKKERALLK